MAKSLAFINTVPHLMLTGSPIRLSFFGVRGVGVVYEMCIPIPVIKIAGIFSSIVLSDMIYDPWPSTYISTYIYVQPPCSCQWKGPMVPHIRTPVPFVPAINLMVPCRTQKVLIPACTC